MNDESTGITLRVRDEGRGEPVLLLHGFADSHAAFWDSGWAASLAGHRILAFDARGHGESSRPHEVSAYADDARVADALRVLDAAGVEQAHVVGYSMGGFSALLLASAAPDRVRSLAAGGAHGGGQSLELLRRIASAGASAFVSAVEQVRPLPEVVRARMLANDDDALRAVVAHDREPFADPAVAAITMPTLLWAGSFDPALPSIASFERRLPNARLFLVHDTEHFGAFDHPDVLREVAAHIERAAFSSRSSSSKTNTWSVPETSR